MKKLKGFFDLHPKSLKVVIFEGTAYEAELELKEMTPTENMEIRKQAREASQGDEEGFMTRLAAGAVQKSLKEEGLTFNDALQIVMHSGGAAGELGMTAMRLNGILPPEKTEDDNTPDPLSST